MSKQNEHTLCAVYISPDEQRLLAKVARSRGVGRDYLALCDTEDVARPVAGRPIPRWLGQQKPAALQKQRKPRCAPQARHCHTCTRLSPVSEGSYACAAGVWTRPLLEQSLHTSRRLRTVSLTCPHYEPVVRRERLAPHHCRACRELVEVGAADERYVCARAVWSNPMKPQSVANARRLARLSAACPHFAPRAGRWLPRS